ncbi:Mitochondrial import inner membrane translocase subunit tim14 [Thalictrum thalictroides]|uniref:Mitochondrial import inner membrane translocase subunit tim14 n=1 Tax=Thalictrum thalictroides TaxID=46969 RepID=A0A7J6X6Y4_THATH|nr:Mitochondrial import inner membrane translocase subunit tim14 [Thalictrum thalictroides]
MGITPVTCFTVAAAALGCRYIVRTLTGPRLRKFYQGGFEKVMTKREAALILGVRERSDMEKIKQAYKRVMLANHPDAGGSPFLARKINEAKDLLLRKTSASGSVFN